MAGLDLEMDGGFAPLGQRLQTSFGSRIPRTLSRTSRQTSRIAQASLRWQGVLVPPSSRHSTGT